MHEILFLAASSQASRWLTCRPAGTVHFVLMDAVPTRPCTCTHGRLFRTQQQQQQQQHMFCEPIGPIGDIRILDSPL